MRTLLSTFLVLMIGTQLFAQIERDKALHYLGGNLFGLVGAGVAKQISDGNRAWTFVGAVAGGALIGLGKEAVDSGQEGNQWDNDDLVATILGGVTVGVTIEIFSKKRNKKKPMGSLTTQRLDWKDFSITSGPNAVLTLSTELPDLTTSMRYTFNP
ncbi:hypothetical protein [uncultured Allomuricauda sp.]|uniref:hypothetical protein n=1 Tax=Flagellimonas sp. W118 TaxID=3410791 RepID=UPI00260EBF35|nr:hypothetical protein [uncultured Allomuricauda sp.]